MSKRKQYDLVGYIYDRYSKSNRFKEEEIIKIPGVTFNSLEEIDRFTAKFPSYYDLSNYLDKKYENKTGFSIRITDNNGRASYRSVIYNNPNLSELVDKLKQGTITVVGKKRAVNLYTGSSKYFRDIWAKVKKQIQKEDRDWLNQVFNNSWYLTLINQYLNRDPFESSPDISILDLERAFKDYGVLRKYITYKDNSIVSNLNVTTSDIPNETTLNKRKVKVETPTNNNPSNDNEDMDSGDYEPDEYAFLEGEEIDTMSGGEGNIAAEYAEYLKHTKGYGRRS